MQHHRKSWYSRPSGFQPCASCSLSVVSATSSWLPASIASSPGGCCRPAENHHRRKAQWPADFHRPQAIRADPDGGLRGQQGHQRLHPSWFYRLAQHPSSARNRDTGVAMWFAVPGIPSPTRPSSDCEMVSVPGSNVAGKIYARCDKTASGCGG